MTRSPAGFLTYAPLARAPDIVRRVGFAGLLAVLGLTLIVAATALGGCATKDATRLAGYEALDAGFQAIRHDAEIGIMARQDPACAQRLSIAPIGPGAAAFSTETLAYHAMVIDWLRKRELGTLKGTEPLPPGPTTAPVPRPRGP